MYEEVLKSMRKIRQSRKLSKGLEQTHQKRGYPKKMKRCSIIVIRETNENV
jgi:hypothetical protein